MQRDHLKKTGIAAAIMLMPGGFILGATIAARYWRARRAAAASAESHD
ncbi:hypothetical protein [Sphingomonas oligophenolica]|nr:hypothetical protein [Sphingomonas oligophenolica]